MCDRVFHLFFSNLVVSKIFYQDTTRLLDQNQFIQTYDTTHKKNYMCTYRCTYTIINTYIKMVAPFYLRWGSIKIVEPTSIQFKSVGKICYLLFYFMNLTNPPFLMTN